MNAYFVGITQQEKNNILDQHKKIYDGYRLVQQNNTEPQPLYVQDFANDKEGFVVNNKGDVKKYTNMGINESQEDFETMEMEEDDCNECGMKETYEDMDMDDAYAYRDDMDMDQPSEEDFQEIGFEFEKPITIRGNVYHNTGDLERGENTNLGSIMNTEDGLRFMSMSNKPEGLTLDELVDLLNHEEVMDMDDMDMHPEADEIDLEDLDAASEFYDKLKSGEGQKPSDRLNKPSDEEDNNWMFVEDEFTESEDLDESFYTQRNKILEMFQRTSRF